MIFLSYWFVAFALIFFPIYWAVRWSRLRLVVLAVGCAIFHGHFAGVAGVLPIIVLGTTTYLIGLTRNRYLCALGMAFCAAALVFYKYTHFLSVQVIGAVAPQLGTQLLQTANPLLPALPPLGISFFVFEFVHYLFEIHRGGTPIGNPLHFGLFSIFWPSLVAGPIKRYGQFIPSLTKGLITTSREDVAYGSLRVATGLLKKGLADNLTIWIDVYSPQFETLSLTWRWIFFLFIALRIYWDFSGYSDMAIGYARMMGVRLPENFNWPYISTSIDEFWRRWHISLSSWIRDYLYIPLGGNRHGLPRKTFNGLVAFGICGLWHGADWNFLVWGLYHGLGLVICANYQRMLGPPGRALGTFFERVPIVSGLFTFLFVGVGWLFFFYQVPVAWKMLQLLVTPTP